VVSVPGFEEAIEMRFSRAGEVLKVREEYTIGLSNRKLLSGGFPAKLLDRSVYARGARDYLKSPFQLVSG